MEIVTVAFDIDDTLTDFSKQKELIEQHFNIEVPRDGYPTYCFGESIGISKEEEADFWDKNLARMIREAEPNNVYSKVMDMVSSFAKEKYEEFEICIFIITAREEKYREITLEWLNKHNIKFDSLIMTSGDSKCDLIDRLNIEFFVEDNPYFFKEVVSKGLVSDYGCVYFKNSRPYNKNSFSHVTFEEKDGELQTFIERLSLN